MARITKLPFSISESHAVSPFDLIHIEIWGPYKECTKRDCRYFLTVVDDHTRYTWLYLLKLKYDTVYTLQKISNYVKTHFNASGKNLRSDNALEYDNSMCKQFFMKMVLFTKPPVLEHPSKMPELNINTGTSLKLQEP